MKVRPVSSGGHLPEAMFQSAVYDKQHDKKQRGEERVYSILQLIVPMEGVREEFKAESETETMLLTGLFPMSHSACFSYTRLPKGGTTHS